MCYIMQERSVGVRELRQNLSKYLLRVKEGETLRVTERGRVVASLGPVPERAHALSRLIADGRIAPARLELEDLGSPIEVSSEGSATEALEELRAED